MNLLRRFLPLPLLALATMFCTAGCHNNQDQAVTPSGQNGAQSSSSDPATANMAPPPPNGANYSQDAYQATDNSGYGEQPEYTADDPPPPLPEYDQPPDPGDNYLWTPGYWAYTQAGYYWVPGVWVQAPYEGALWTPGYWGFWHNHYRFYPGYWGEYIGFYGGVDYGYGYTGYGYQGGYWGGGQFYYNRSVNNVNVSVVHNVYNRSVSGNNRGVRVSFNGGSGGVQVQAKPAELAAMRAPHTAPMTAQVRNEHAASTNRAQFASVNKGRPASLAVPQPLAADRNVRVPAALKARNQAAAPQREAAPQQLQRQAVPAQQQRQEVPPQRPAASQQQQQRPPAPPQRQEIPQQQQHQAAPQQQHQAAPRQQQQRPEAQPQQKPAAAPQQRQAAPQQQRQAAPQQPPQRQAAPPGQKPAAAPQHQAAPQQHQAAPKHAAAPQSEEDTKKK